VTLEAWPSRQKVCKEVVVRWEGGGAGDLTGGSGEVKSGSEGAEGGGEVGDWRWRSR